MQASPTLSCPPDFTRRLGVILACLVALIAQRFLRDPFHVALNVPLGTFIKLAAQRLDLAFTRFAAGILPRPRAARPHAGGPHAKRVFPTRRGWLTAALGSEAAAYACQLEHLLAEPEAAAALAGSLTARRLLAPIRHMLGYAPAQPRRPRVRVRPQPQPAPAPAPAPVAAPRPTPPAWMREYELPPSAHLQWMPPRRFRSG
jgi:hypothetical protein